MGRSDILVTARIPHGAPNFSYKINRRRRGRQGVSHATRDVLWHVVFVAFFRISSPHLLCLLWTYSYSLMIVGGKTTPLKSNDECAMFAKRIAKLSDIPAECREMMNQSIVATSPSKLYVPSWECVDEYSGA